MIWLDLYLYRILIYKSPRDKYSYSYSLETPKDLLKIIINSILILIVFQLIF